MLGSSSTPILGSLLSSYSESPNHNHHSEFNSPKHVLKKWSFHHTQAGRLHLVSPSSHSFNSSSFSNADVGLKTGFRRAQSEGNLEGLLSDSCSGFDEFNHSNLTRKFPRKPGCAMLQTIPSFSVYNPSRTYEEGEVEEEEESGEESEEEMVMVQNSNQGRSLNTEIEDLSKAFYNKMRLQDSNVLVQESDHVLCKMHLATGLGVASGGFSGGGGGHNEHKPENSVVRVAIRLAWKSTTRKWWSRILSKKDLGKAEEYYSRAILVDPGHGEILSQYAQETWELHGDEDRASSYFERSVHASPEDSQVLAAYAGFLWETEEAEDDLCMIPPLLYDNIVIATAL